MAILYKTSLESVEVYPELNGNANVIRVVTWQFNFYDETQPEVFTVGMAETLLPQPAEGDPFEDISVLTKEQILQWAIDAEGGKAFFDMIRPVAEEHLAHLLKKAGTIQYDISTLN